MYKVFIRNWWKKNPKWHNGLEPDPTARKTTLTWVNTEEEAREIAQEYNATHKPGILSRKAEYTKE
tara:strand:- start:649 stop:846 length:198 start_codon:yes stop_codon:yes gene_type:complete